jgi:hypothetical protein
MAKFMEKITKRDMYEAIAEAMDTGSCKFPADEVKAFCAKEIELLDKKAAKAKERAAEKRAEGDELTDTVAAALSDTEFEPISVIAARVDNPDATTAKVTYRLTQLVKAGKAEKQEITIPATDGGKSRKVQGYRLIG